jgi:hypothetical protein
MRIQGYKIINRGTHMTAIIINTTLLLLYGAIELKEALRD